MTEKMPEHIKNCFIYRKAFRDIKIRKKNVGFIVTGSTGSGKSWFALKLAHDLDPTFTAERVVYTTEDFLRLLVEGDSKGKLHKGMAIVFDETSHDEAMDSRSSLSQGNKQMASLSTIYRAMRLVVIYVAPNLNQIDSRVRSVSITALFTMKGIDYKRKRSSAKIFWVVQNSRDGEVFHKRPKVVSEERHIQAIGGVSFGMPPAWLINDYERKKMAFIKRKLELWYANVKQSGEDKPAIKKKSVTDIAADILRNRKLFEVKPGKVSIFKIAEQFGINTSKASQIASYVNSLGK